MTDFRALCAELVQFAEQEEERAEMDPVWGNAGQYDYGVLDRARTALAQPEPTQDLSQLSDGYHTFADLYEHRHALCLALMRAIPMHCWFSWRHADGERCFGGNDWFIIGIEPPGGNSVTYHLPAELYPAARATGAVELEKGRPWDGHSAADVALRLKEWATLAQPESKMVYRYSPVTIAECGGPCEQGPECCDCGEIKGELEPQPEPQEPTDEEIMEVFWEHQNGLEELWADDWPAAARAVLARWGRPSIEPVPMNKCRPGAEDCDAKGRCWMCGKVDGDWRLISTDNPGVPQLKYVFSHWLPHWALPVPQQETE